MLNDLKNVILEAYDAGRMTQGRARELLSLPGIMEFRVVYMDWREAKDAIPARNMTAKRLIDLHNAARALMDATDNGDQFLEPDRQHVKNLIRAALYWHTDSVHEAVAEFKKEHQQG